MKRKSFYFFILVTTLILILCACSDSSGKEILKLYAEQEHKQEYVGENREGGKVQWYAQAGERTWYVASVSDGDRMEFDKKAQDAIHIEQAIKDMEAKGYRLVHTLEQTRDGYTSAYILIGEKMNMTNKGGK